MGYELRIVRGPDYFDNPAQQIPFEEWQAVVQADPALTPSECNPEMVDWSGPCDYGDNWFAWFHGSIHTKNPDERTIAKMLQLAARLGAEVRGDNRELWISPTEYRSET